MKTLRIFALFFILGLNQTALYAQGGCIEIERILAAACGIAGQTEGYNEMLFFRVGSNPVNVANISVTWPTSNQVNFYNFLGLIQDGTTAAKVAEINATIQTCGHLKEPVNGIIPANAKVIFFTSQQVSATFNSFANLTDTLIAIFQNNTSRIGGHFLNSTVNTGIPPAGTDDQTTIISFGGNCTDQVTYLRTSLLTTAGIPGNEPGATVLFTPDGSTSYFNNGCVAPFPPYNADWTNPGPLCADADPINLNKLITGTKGGTWTGPGVTDSTLNVTGLSGNITVTYSISPLPNCPNLPPASASKTINIIPSANAAWTNPDTLCNKNNTFDLNTLVTGTPGGTWSGWNVLPNGTWNLTNLSGSFPVSYFVGSGDCKDTLLQNVFVVVSPKLNVTGLTTYCVGEEAKPLTTTPAIGGTVTWYADSTLAQQIANGTSFTPPSESGTYFVIQEVSGCKSDPAKVEVKFNFINTTLSAEPDSGYAPLLVNITGSGENTDECKWYQNDTLIQFSGTESVNFTKPGTYTIKLLCTNNEGCTDSSSVTIKVIDADLSIEIPNVFTPNGDTQNDIFTVKQNAVKTFSGVIFNRWGKKLYEWSDVAGGWDGKINGNKPIDGVYFYVIKGTDLKDKAFDFSGTVQIVSAE